MDVTMRPHTLFTDHGQPSLPHPTASTCEPRVQSQSSCCFGDLKRCKGSSGAGRVGLGPGGFGRGANNDLSQELQGRKEGHLRVGGRLEV